MHKLLEYQLRKITANDGSLDVPALLKLVEQSYEETDRERRLNDRATNENRGRIFSAYLLVNFSSIIAGQMLFATGNPSSFVLFSLSAVFYALCLIPMGLTQLPQPHAAHVPSLRPLRLYRTSPVGVVGCIAVGFANSAVWTLALSRLPLRNRLAASCRRARSLSLISAAFF